ncbi:MAG: hypothetical protein IPM54_25065 [Polyangiaceae bacterium]|nr:hypothetical protein [Polyangiaceae bacterium]
MPAIDISRLVDTSTFDAEGRPGLTYRRIYGARVPLEWFVRRFLAPRDGLPWALGHCIDLPAFVNATPTFAQLAQWRAAFDAEGSRTEYVTRVSSTLTLGEDERLRYAPNVTLGRTGTFPLLVTIDKAGDILAQFPIL